MAAEQGFNELETIVAVATAPGRGAIGVVRLSGRRAREIVEPLLRLRRPLGVRRPQLAQVLIPELGTLVAVDDALVTWFAAPYSYTAEDVIELSVHGSPVVLEAILTELVRQGARLAEPGEFTRRAVQNGRLDLTKAEAVNDLIGAVTLHGARVAAAQLGGSLARAVRPAKERFVARIAEAEARIEFAEADGSLGENFGAGGAQDKEELLEIRGELAKLSRTFRYGRMLREGFSLAIVGRPNVGKSSLFNRLLGRERAIVTAESGTTRDPIRERCVLAGLPVDLIDTAGLREEGDRGSGDAEVEGMARSKHALAEADIVLLVVDASAALPGGGEGVELTELEEDLLGQLAGRPFLRVLSRCDLLVANCHAADGDRWILTSARTGQGIRELEERVVAMLTGAAPGLEGTIVTSVRQQTALLSALERIDAAVLAIGAGLPDDVWVVDLYAALEALDSLTGATTTDAILDRIFAGFCVGK